MRDARAIVTCLAVLLAVRLEGKPNEKPNGDAQELSRVLELSLLFYEAQRSGKLGPDNRIPWRADSALDDRGLNGEDLTGGYYDAGDFVKFGFTMAWTTTLLAWSAVSWPEAYAAAGQLDVVRAAVKWATDYFIKCHTREYELYGQVGDFGIDHTFWGRPEDLNLTRPAYKIDPQNPGSDLAGETAAALAAASLLFSDIDGPYSARLVRHARQLYSFADEHRGLYHGAIHGAAQYYESPDYGDELAWAAAWLYRATNESRYLDEAQHHYRHFHLGDRPAEFSYGKKLAGVQVLMAQVTGQQEYRRAARAFCDFSVGKQKRTPRGLLYIDKFGTLCLAANVAFVCLQAADLLQPDQPGDPDGYRRFSRQQIRYMLGGDSERSFVVGWGREPPEQPYHAASSCPDRPAKCGWEQLSRDAPNPQPLLGALVSGPDETDYFLDRRQEYLYTEVTLDCNAGFTGALAGLIQLSLNATTRDPR